MKPQVMLAALSLIAISGCSATEMQCQREAGQLPYLYAGAFGLVGVAIAETTPERKAWHAKVDQCVAEKQATLIPADQATR